MSERDASNHDELRLEMEGLRAENRRLRSLLGLEAPEQATAEPPPAPDWEPTLFRDTLASTGRAPANSRRTAARAAVWSWSSNMARRARFG